jgi:hypothetical protein
MYQQMDFNFLKEKLYEPHCAIICVFAQNFGVYCLYSPIVKPSYGQHYMQLHSD